MMAEKWKKMKMWQQSLIVFVIVGVIALAIIMMKPETYEILYSNLDPKEAVRIEQELGKIGLPSKIEGEGTTILTDGIHITKAKAHLATLGLPNSGDPGFELLEQDSIGSTKFDKEKRYERALVGDIQNGLVEGFEFVNKAIVQLNYTVDNSIFAEQTDSKASVTIHTKDEKSLTESQVQAIRSFVASSVKNLSVDNVDVMDKNGIVYESNDGNGATAGGYAKQLEIVELTETRIRNDIMRMLAPNFGSENVTLVVRANINFDEIIRNIERYDPEGTLVSRQESTEQVQKREGEGVIEPGTDSNGTVPDYELDETNSTVSLNQEKVEIMENFEVGKTVETIKENPELTDIRVTATINESVNQENMPVFVLEWEELIANAAGIVINPDGTFENGFVKVSPQVYSVQEKDEQPSIEEVSTTQDMKMLILVGLLVLIGIIVLVIAMLLKKKQKKKDAEQLEYIRNQNKLNGVAGQGEGNNEGFDEKKSQEQTEALLSQIDKSKRTKRVELADLTQEQEKLAMKVREFAEENPRRTADYIKKLIKEG